MNIVVSVRHCLKTYFFSNRSETTLIKKSIGGHPLMTSCPLERVGKGVCDSTEVFNVVLVCGPQSFFDVLY